MSSVSKKPNYPADMNPPPALSEIVTNLWQGRRPETYIGFDLVVSCEQFLAKRPMEDYAGMTLHVPLRDEDDFELPDVLYEAAGLVSDVMQDGRKVLVHCTGGLNRSSLVTVLALSDLGYGTPKECIAMLRRVHDPYCLCNRAFERWLTGERLPTAETSTFRLDAA